MICATIYLPKAEWTIYAYIAVTGYYADEILDKMREIGAGPTALSKAQDNLLNGHLNTGLTYSSHEERKTVWVVALTSSAQEFFNTIVHEIRHVSQHIANDMELDENSEDVCYLSGDIAFELFPYCRSLLCEHCRGQKTRKIW